MLGISRGAVIKLIMKVLAASINHRLGEDLETAIS